MPRLSLWLVRTALIWLGIGQTLGGLVLANKGLPLLPWLWTLRSSHIHILLIGWTVQLAFGVAFWILPRLGGGSRGNERLVVLCYATLNLGVLLAALHDPLASLVGLDALWPLPVLTGLCYVVAAAAFLIHAFPRVLPLPTLPTEKP